MVMPIVGLLIFGLWRQRTAVPPGPGPTKFGIITKIIKEPVYPVDVWAGRDTKLAFDIRTKGVRPTKWRATDSDWLYLIRIIARKNGKDRILYRSDKDGDAYAPLIPAQSFSHGSAGMENLWYRISFSLSQVPREWGEIWLYLDVGLRSAPSPNILSVNTSTIAQLKAQGGALWTSKALRLRRDGEDIKMPPVSPKPQLALKSWKVTPLGLQPNGLQDFNLEMRLFDSGPLKSPGPANIGVQADERWQVFNEQGLYCGGFNGNQVDVDLEKGQRHYLAMVRFSVPSSNRPRKLYLKGQLSCNHRWPLLFSIPLPNAKGKTT